MPNRTIRGVEIYVRLAVLGCVVCGGCVAGTDASLSEQTEKTQPTVEALHLKCQDGLVYLDIYSTSAVALIYSWDLTGRSALGQLKKVKGTRYYLSSPVYARDEEINQIDVLSDSFVLLNGAIEKGRANRCERVPPLF